MNHPPTRLALLISLIGAGMAPGAQAGMNPVDLQGGHAIGSMRSQTGELCDPFGAFALDECGTAAGQLWQPVGRSLERAASVGVRVLYTVPADDRAPVEFGRQAQHPTSAFGPGAVPSDEVLSGPGIELHEMREAGRLRDAAWRGTSESSERSAMREMRGTRQEGQTHQTRQTPRTGETGERGGWRKTSPVEPRQHAGPRKPRLSSPMAAIVRTPLASIGWSEIGVERFAPLESPPAHAAAAPAATDRLLESLAATLHGSQPAATDAVAAAMPAEASPSPGEPVPYAVAPLRVEQPLVAFETQTGRVLRQLGAILANERDEVGAARLQAPETSVMTHADKVFLMLGEVSSSAQPPAEDGAERRLRKLAARAAQAEAKAATEAATEAAATLAAEIARDGVDLALPLEMLANSPSLAAAQTPPAPAVIVPVAVSGDASVAESQRTADAGRGAVSTAPVVPAPRRNPFGDERQLAIAEGALDRVRGGFSINGLNISFGVERAVYVNGALVTTTSLNVSDLGRMTAGRGTTAFDVGTIGLIQSGAGNVVSPTIVSAGSVGTVVQNTLDGQKIQNITVINATSNGLGVLKGLNLQSSLRGAVIDSLRR